MVLIITCAERSRECAERIRAVTGEVVQVVAGVGLALNALRRQEFSVAVIDDSLMWNTDGKMTDLLAGAGGLATMLVMNFAISGVERVVFEVRAALHRRERELQRAQEKAENRLRADLNEAVTGILLSSQLAMDDPLVPAPTARKIRSVYELAMSMRDRLKAA